MAQIILDDSQLQAIHQAKDTVEVRDRHGNLVGCVMRGATPEEIALARERLTWPGPWHTTEQFRDRLNALEP